MISWLLSLFLMAISAFLSYLASQILFGAVIVDTMAGRTERMITGTESRPHEVSIIRQWAYLIGQEIPRTLFPVLLSVFLMAFGWLMPLGPVISFISSLSAAVFLAWDNTDIIPARHFTPFRERLKFLMRNLPFHLGFGICFFIPVLNILFLSFAPVGATLYHLDLRKKETREFQSS